MPDLTAWDGNNIAPEKLRALAETLILEAEKCEDRAGAYRRTAQEYIESAEEREKPSVKRIVDTGINPPRIDPTELAKALGAN